MVPGNNDGCDSDAMQSCKGCVVKLFALCGRVYAIEDISADDNGIDGMLGYRAEKAFQKALMVRMTLLIHQLLAEMPVGGMENAVGPSTFGRQ